MRLSKRDWHNTESMCFGMGGYATLWEYIFCWQKCRVLTRCDKTNDFSYTWSFEEFIAPYDYPDPYDYLEKEKK